MYKQALLTSAKQQCEFTSERQNTSCLYDLYLPPYFARESIQLAV